MSRRGGKRRDARGRRLSDEELEIIFENLCDHIEELRDDRNPLLKVCSYNECDEGEDMFTVYLDNAKSVKLTRMYEHIAAFNRKTGNRIEVEAETDEDGGTSWMMFIPLFVPHSRNNEPAEGAYTPAKRRTGPDYGELVKWVSVLVGCNILGDLLNQQTLYSLVKNVLHV